MMIFKQLLLGLALSAFSFISVADEIEAVLAWTDIHELGFPVQGVVEKINVQAGELVNKSQSLARLEQKPFQLMVKKHQALVATIEPLLLDARLELTQAEELFERTVLSEVELQKVEAKYKGLEAQSQVEKTDLQLAEWTLQKATLSAPYNGIVIASNMLPGQVISEENSADFSIQIARKGMMSAKLQLSSANGLKMAQSVKVRVGSNEYPGKVHSILILEGGQQYQLEVKFNHPGTQQYWPGQKASVVF